MASSSEANKSPNPKEEEPAPAEPEKKKKMRRFTQRQIDYFIESGEPWQTPEDNNPSIMENLTEEDRARYTQEFMDRLAAVDADRQQRKARMLALEEMLREERQGVLDQYYAKGYAEYEVDQDADEEEEEEEPAVPRALRPSRRRLRRGLVRRTGGRGTKRLN